MTGTRALRKIVQLSLIAANYSLCVPAVLHAQNGCGDTLDWTSSVCQQIGSGSLNPEWTVVSRHGEYAQNETECNTPGAISAEDSLVINTSAQSYRCGDFNTDGSIRTTPASWPYTTGDIQWNNFSFQHGTVTVRAKFPKQDTGLWPAVWFLATNCQNTNKYSGDTGFGGCPNIGTSGYQEIDMLEFMGPTGYWPQANFFNPSGGHECKYNQSPINDGNFHTYIMTWTASALSFTVDGASSGCSYTSGVPNGAMFMIIQTQTTTNSNAGPPNKANLPAQLTVEFVQVQDQSGKTIFYDDFTKPAPPTGLKAVVH